MEKCLTILKNSTSDNEKFAALLLVVKSIKANEVDQSFRKKIFQSVGFSFINRLLLTTSVPEGCSENVYRSLALTLLACFSTDEELAKHPQLTQKIPVFVSTLSDSVLDSSQLNDVLQCLSAQAAVPQGRLQVVKCGALEALARCYLSGSKDSLSVFLHLVSGEWNSEVWSAFVSHFNAAMEILTGAFSSNQDIFKFELLSTLTSILSTGTWDQHNHLDFKECQNWLKLVGTGLMNVFQSRVDVSHQKSAIFLSALLTQLFSLKWALLSPAEDRKASSFLCLLIRLVSVEFRLTLEGPCLDEVFDRTDALSHCLILLEHAIVLIASSADSTADMDLSQETLFQVHTTLREGLDNVVLFLLDLQEQNVALQKLAQEPVVLGVVRVLGAWLAEDTLSLSEEAHKALPFLVQLAGYEPDEGEAVWCGRDVLPFLLPGFCQLVSEDKPRNILIKSNCPSLLQKHMLWLYTEHIQKKPGVRDVLPDVTGQCMMCCSVLHTVCICHWDLVNQDQGQVFSAVFGTSCKILQSELCPASSLELTVNLAFLVVLIWRRREGHVSSKEKDYFAATVPVFMPAVVECVQSSTSKAKDVKQLWRSVSEPTLLLIQEMAALLKCDAVFKDLICSKCKECTTELQLFADSSSKAISMADSDVWCVATEFLASLQT